MIDNFAGRRTNVVDSGPLGSAKSGGRRRVDLIATLGIVGLAAIGIFALVLWRYHAITTQAEERAALRASERAYALASVLADTLTATFLQAESMHGLARRLTDARLAHDAEAEAELRSYLDASSRRGGPGVAQVAAILPSGSLLWSNLNWTPGVVDLSDREHFRIFLNHPEVQNFLSSPVLGKVSGRWTVQFARPQRTDRGELRAVAVVSLDADLIRRLCKDLDLAPDDIVTLARDDGTVLMRRDMGRLGEKLILSRETLDAADARLPQARPGQLDGVPRFMASHEVASIGAQVVVGLSRASVMRALAATQDALWTGTMLLEAAVVLVAGSAGLIVILLRRSGIEAARSESLAESEAWFRSIFDNAAEGVIVTERGPEGALRISYANMCACALYGRSPSDVAGHDSREFVLPEETAGIEARAAAMAGGAHAGRMVYRLRQPDGRIVRVSAETVLVPDLSGRGRIRFWTTFRDVTEDHARDSALAEARARVDHMMEVAPGVFYQLALEGDRAVRVDFVSQSVETMFGVSVAEASTLGTLSERAGFDVAPVRSQALRQAKANGVGVAEYRIRLSDRDFWIRDTIRRITGGDGAEQIVGFISDVTAEHEAAEARRAAERELARSNRALEAFSRSLGALIRSDNLSELLTAVCESIVTDQACVLACVGVPVVAEGSPVNFLAAVGPAAEYLKAIDISWSAERPGGHGPTGTALREGRSVIVGDFDADPLVAFWLQQAAPYGIRSSVNIPCCSSGRVAGVLIVHASEPQAFGADELALLERLADEVAFAITLEEERDRFRAAEENLRAAAELGPGLLYRANVGADGFTVKSTFGAASRIAQDLLDDSDAPGTLERLMNASEQSAAIEALPVGARYSHDLPVVTPDGGARWLRNDVRVTGRGDRAVDVIGYLTEITLEKQQHLQSQQIDTLLTLGEMATSMAHELSQPLASISFAAQNAGRLLRRNPSEVDAVAGKLDKIVGETQRAGRLIDHMRVFARNEHTAKAPIAWRDVLASALELMTWQTANSRIVDAIAPDLPRVMGEAIPMEQVLINLISNAIDAYLDGPRETPVIVRVEGFLRDGMVVLRVADQAGGFPPHVLPRVFEPFFTTTPPGKGTGLGMAIVFGTVVEMGGSVSAANENGGAAVEIRLPAAPGD